MILPCEPWGATKTVKLEHQARRFFCGPLKSLHRRSWFLPRLLRTAGQGAWEGLVRCDFSRGRGAAKGPTVPGPLGVGGRQDGLAEDLLITSRSLLSSLFTVTPAESSRVVFGQLPCSARDEQTHGGGGMALPQEIGSIYQVSESVSQGFCLDSSAHCHYLKIRLENAPWIGAFGISKNVSSPGLCGSVD